MDTAEEVEAAYARLCDTVQREALRIFGLAGVGRSDEAAEAAAELAQTALTAKHQRTMRQETVSTSRYDLAGLRVDISVPSDSETGYEDKG